MLVGDLRAVAELAGDDRRGDLPDELSQGGVAGAEQVDAAVAQPGP